jgi:thioredoxin-dependent peroxiredoxin
MRLAICRSTKSSSASPLISVAAGVAEDYDAYVEKNIYGKKRMGIKRSIFVTDADGNVARATYGGRPEGDADEVSGVARLND